MNFKDIAIFLIKRASEVLPIINYESDLKKSRIFSKKELRFIKVLKCDPQPVFLSRYNAVYPKAVLINYFNQLLNFGDHAHVHVIEKLVNLI